jgi:PUA domain protein
MTVIRHLKDRESKQIIKDFITKYPLSEASLSSVKHLEELAIEDVSVFFADGKPWILHTSKGTFPSLKYEAVLSTLPKVIVDMGAVPHVANGAQIMRPGVSKIEGQFAEGDLVVILDEKYRKTIALGIAEIDSDTMQSTTKGRVINNIHYVGDQVWKSFGTVK